MERVYKTDQMSCPVRNPGRDGVVPADNQGQTTIKKSLPIRKS